MLIPICCAVLTAFLAPSARAETLTLNDALAEAAEANPSLQSARDLVMAAEAGRWTDALPQNPDVFIELEGIPSGGSPGEYGERKLGVRQVLEYPAAYGKRSRLAGLDIQEARWAYTAAYGDIARAVTTVFRRAQMLDGQLGVHRGIRNLAVRALSNAERRRDAGEATPYDALRARVTLAEAENAVRRTETDLQSTLYELKQLLGRGPAETVAVTGDFTADPAPVDTDSLKRTAVNRNPRLRVETVGVERRRAEYDLARLALVPTVSAGMFLQRFRDGDETTGWGGDLGLSLPVWSFWKERGRIRAAKLRVDAAGWRMEDERRRVLAAVETAAARMAAARDRLATYRTEILDASTELVRIAERRFEEGETGYLELSEAIETMQRVRIEHLELVYEYLVAEAELTRAVGPDPGVISNAR